MVHKGTYLNTVERVQKGLCAHWPVEESAGATAWRLSQSAGQRRSEAASTAPPTLLYRTAVGKQFPVFQQACSSGGTGSTDFKMKPVCRVTGIPSRHVCCPSGLAPLFTPPHRKQMELNCIYIFDMAGSTCYGALRAFLLSGTWWSIVCELLLFPLNCTPKAYFLSSFISWSYMSGHI